MSGTAVSVTAFLVLAAAAIGLEAAARRNPPRGRRATAGQAAAAVMRTTPGRIAVLVAWIWIGVHFLAR